jgi:hypothetical protein
VQTMHTLRKRVKEQSLENLTWEDLVEMNKKENEVWSDRILLHRTLSNRNFPVRNPNALPPLESHYSIAGLSHVPTINALVLFPPIDKDSLKEPQEVVPKGLALLDTVNGKLPSVSVW